MQTLLVHFLNNVGALLTTFRTLLGTCAILLGWLFLFLRYLQYLLCSQYSQYLLHFLLYLAYLIYLAYLPYSPCLLRPTCPTSCPSCCTWLLTRSFPARWHLSSCKKVGASAVVLGIGPHWHWWVEVLCDLPFPMYGLQR